MYSVHLRDRLKRRILRNIPSLDDIKQEVVETNDDDNNNNNNSNTVVIINDEVNIDSSHPLLHPTDKLRKRKEFEIQKKNLELNSLDIESLHNQKIFDINVSFESDKKRKRRRCVGENNTKITIFKYNPEENSY